MSKTKLPSGPKIDETDGLANLRKQYGCGPVQFSATEDALYERHLIFDNIVNESEADPRAQFEAFARSISDILSQRWVRTEAAYSEENPKRVYYLSMEFLIGKSLANNVTNLMLDPVIQQTVKQKELDWISLLEQEPDAGLGNGGLGDWQPVFSIQWPLCSCPPWATVCVTSTGFFGRALQTVGSTNSPTIGFAFRTRGKLHGRVTRWK
jgi:glycogen phosphorylase